MRQETVKSDVQKQLEQDGWKLLTNRFASKAVDRGWAYNPKTRLSEHRGYEFREAPLPTDDELIEEYRSQGCKDVLVAAAFDIHGNLLPEARAVYLKR